MKLIFTIGSIVGLFFFYSCSNDDIPTPIDCSTSTLEITLVSKMDISSCGVSDGSITVAVNGGKNPYSLSINGGASSSSPVFNNLPAGTHNVLVVDANECERTLVVTINDPGSNFTATTVTVEDNACLTDNGSITVNVTGGTEPYMFKFGTGSFGATNTFAGLKHGSYTIEVKDATDCPKVINAIVPRGDTGISYENDIKPIIQTNCIKSGCHNGDNGADRNWSIFTNVKSNAQAIKTRTGNGSMPQDQVASGGLPQSQRDLIACWVDDGAKDN